MLFHYHFEKMPVKQRVHSTMWGQFEVSVHSHTVFYLFQTHLHELSTSFRPNSQGAERENRLVIHAGLDETRSRGR